MKIAFALAILFIAIVVGYFEQQDTTTAPPSIITSKERSVAIPATITKAQAVALISELPEIKAWSSYIERTTEGKVHGMIMEPPEESTTINGKQYWLVDFYENHPTHSNRWESFLVSLDSKDILVNDIIDGVITLQEWRNSKKSMERIRNAP